MDAGSRLCCGAEVSTSLSESIVFLLVSMTQKCKALALELTKALSLLFSSTSLLLSGHQQLFWKILYFK